ncbi:MAG: hypothetical protein ACP5QA_15115, partial [Phycisphaerae bacterium]
HHHTAIKPSNFGRGRYNIIFPWAELDGPIAHPCRLSEEEFVHILGTFPLVPDPVKVAAHNAYRDVERGVVE